MEKRILFYFSFIQNNGPINLFSKTLSKLDTKIKYFLKSILFTIIMIYFGKLIILANPPTLLSNSVTDFDGNGGAIINEQCTYVVFCTSTSVPPNVSCLLQITDAVTLDMGTPINLGSNIYAFQLTTVPIPTANLTMNGNRTTPVRIILTNASGTVTVSPLATIFLDGTPPSTNGPLVVTVNGTPHTTQIIKKGDELRFSQQMSSAYQASPAPGEYAELRFAAWGIDPRPMSYANPHILENFIFPEGIENITGNVQFYARDPYGNELGPIDAKQLTVDTRPPQIGNVTVTITPAGVARPGSQVTVTVTISNPDPQGETVTVSNPHLDIINFPLNNLGGGNYSYTFQVASSPPAALYVGPSTFSVTVRDDAQNIATATSPIFQINNKLAPTPAGPTIITYNGVNFLGGPSQTIRKTDVLNFSQQITAETYQAGEVAVISFADWGLGSYTMSSANPHVLNNLSITDPVDDNTPRNIYFQAWDLYNNTIGPVIARSNVYIDTIPPVIVSANATTSEGITPARPGHTLNIVVELQTYDFDTVTVSSPYLGLSNYTLNHVSGTNRFEGSVVIQPSPTLPAFNGMASISVIVTDNGNNLTTGTTSLFALDNRLPDIVKPASASFIENKPVFGDNIAIASDTLLIVATATWAPTQNVKVYTNLSSIGGPNSIELLKVGENLFQLTYIIPVGNSEDTVAKTFQVWAEDSVTGNTIDTWTTPPLRIDNTLPIISQVIFTKILGIGSSFRAGDKFRIRAKVLNLMPSELGITGAVTVDLSKVNSIYSTKELLVQNPVDPEWFEGEFTVGSFDPATGWDTNSAIPYIDLVASDAQGNFYTASVSMSMPIDNEPPVIATTAYQYFHNWYPSEDYNVARIWDTLSFHVKVASYSQIPDKPLNVKLNLSAIGGPSSVDMVYRAGSDGWFDYTYSNLATGTINRQFIVFPITVSDNNENTDLSSITIFIDNCEPKVNQLDLVISYKPNTNDSFPNVINLNKILSFVIPYTQDIPDDHATGVIDLSYVGYSSTYLLSSDSLKYYATINTSSPTSNIQATNYRFAATIQDLSGNKKVVYTPSGYTVDCWPPAILYAEARVLNNATVATIGQSIYFAVRVRDNEGVIPTLNLSNIGGESSVTMIASTTPPAGEWFHYTFTISTGTLNYQIASWLVNAFDDVMNSVTTYTNTLYIDNFPPNASVINVTGMENPNGNIKLGDNLTFTIPYTESGGNAVIDLTIVGGSANTIMNYNPGTGFVYNFTTQQTNQRYINASFSAIVTDINGNKIRVFSPVINIIDCQPPIFNTNLITHGIFISETNGDNPLPNVANTNDIITVFASLSNYIDALATATIYNYNDLTTPLTEITLSYVPLRNRHEGSFVIPPGIAPPWQLNLATLTYVLSASDTVNNISNTVSGNSNFRVKNILPTIESYQFNLNPNVYKSSIGGNLVYNVGSMSAGYIDRLWVVASLTLPSTITKAELNLSQIGGPSALSIPYFGSIASTTTGIDLISYIGQRDMGNLASEISVKLYDEAGNPAIGSISIWVDTKRPTLSGAWFDGSSLTVTISEKFESLSTNTWFIVGSSTSGLEVSLQLTGTGADADNWLSFGSVEHPYFVVELSTAHRKTIAQWASTPLYLRVQSTSEAPLIDNSGNWLVGYSYYPITLTDSTWRQPARLQFVNLTNIPNWPNTFTLVMRFDQQMDPSSLVASAGLIFVDHQEANYFDIPDYSKGYIFQASDIYSWDPDGRTLRITFCTEGRDWIARYLRDKSYNKTLKFANRRTSTSPPLPFAKDSLDRPMYEYSCATGSSFIITDDRPNSFAFYVDLGISAPVLNLNLKTLKFETNDRILLYLDDFKRAIGILDPTLELPKTSLPVSDYKGKIRVYAGNPPNFASYTTLLLKDLDTTKNNIWASKTCTIDLTDNDFANLIALSAYRGSGGFWLEILPNAFYNIWGTPLRRYGPTEPDILTTIYPTTSLATFTGCVVSDEPPVRAWSANTFEFHFEYDPYYLGSVEIPILLATPSATIASAGVGGFSLEGEFVGWDKRVVDGRNRYIAKFRNKQAFPVGIEYAELSLSISGVRDAFNVVPDVTNISKVYSFSATSTSGLPAPNRGYNTASITFVFDSIPPQAIAVSPNDYIPALPINTEYFFIDFNEPLDTSTSAPSVVIATTGHTIPLTFSRWISNTKLAYRNAIAISPSLPNGTWSYQISGGVDLAGNTAITTSFNVEVRTNAPNIIPTSVALNTIQSTIHPTNIVQNQPYSSLVYPGVGTLTFEYQALPENLPHTARVYDSFNTLVGTANILFSGLTGYITIQPSILGYPGNIGPINYSIRIRDNVGNETATIYNLVYDSLQPTLDQFYIQFPTSIGTFSNGVYYYSPLAAASNLTVIANTVTTTDDLRLALFSLSSNSTTTINLTQNPIRNYFVSFGYSNNYLNNGAYMLSVVDMAGNIHNGSSPLQLFVETTPPEVFSISPVDPVIIGPTSPYNATFTLVFNEIMASYPVLRLENGLNIIQTAFVKWADNSIATTAYYTNITPISKTTTPTGFYTYKIEGGRDLAGNLTNTNISVSRQVYILTTGPSPLVRVWTNQPRVFGNIWRSTDPYSPLVGLASITVTYTTTQNVGTHELIVFDKTTPIATFSYTCPPSPATVELSTDTSSWLSFIPLNAGPATYSLWIRDQYGNFSNNALASLTYDTYISPIVSFSFSNPSSGIATNGIQYYSPRFGNFTLSFSTSPQATEPIRLVASYNNTILSNNNILTYPAYSVSTGANLLNKDGLYHFDFFDFAGNIATTTPFALYVDSASPSIVSIIPSIQAGIPEIGPAPAGSVNFAVQFNEPMNSLVVPNGRLQHLQSYPPAIINLNFVNWLSSTTAIFTNASPITSTTTQGTYTFLIYDARDLAGNKMIPPTSGQFTIRIHTQGPTFTSVFRTMQYWLLNNLQLIDQPLSNIVDPGVGTLSITYTSPPYAQPHNLLVYDSLGNNISTIAISISNNLATATLGSTAFNNPINQNLTTYTLRICDTYGNISNSYKYVYFDNQPPIVSSLTFAGVSNATDAVGIYYYNFGNITIDAITNATDPQRLVLGNTVSTFTYLMTKTSTGFRVVINPSSNPASFIEGFYLISIADLAGNMAEGVASTAKLVIDRTPPTVINVVSSPTQPIPSLATGDLSISVTFSEPMNQKTATPSLTLATSGVTIPFKFNNWLANNIAEFVSDRQIDEWLPQGMWNINITGTDLALNNVVAPLPQIEIRSRGPKVKSYRSFSFQQTTASDANEILVNEHFSFNVYPNAATLSIELDEVAVTPISINFIDSSGIVVGSYPLTFNAENKASFTWSIINGPIPINPTTYQIKLVNNRGKSREFYNWTNDSNVPIVLNSPTLNAEIIGTQTAYFNPLLGSRVRVTYDATDTSILKLRVRGISNNGYIISTDTYYMNFQGGNSWLGEYNGRYSRGGTPKPLATDGVYILDIVDAAGNVGVPNGSFNIIATAVIDTLSPVVSTYSFYVNGLPRSKYYPAAGLLDVLVESSEPLTATGIYWLEVRNDANMLIRTLPLQASGSGYVASWDGKNMNGIQVIDGIYHFNAADYTRNRSTARSSIALISSVFRLQSVSQITSKTVDIAFNHEIDPSTVSLSNYSVTAQTSITPTMISSTVIRLYLEPGLQHNVLHTITVDSNLKNIEGISIAPPNNTITLTADAKGPELVRVNLDSVSNSNELILEFNEELEITSAQATASYKITRTDNMSEVNLLSATLRSDRKSVLITLMNNLSDKITYQVTASNIRDIYYNLGVGNTLSFTGKDITPPQIKVSAFSNAANEFNIIIVVQTDEPLMEAPTIKFQQTNLQEISVSAKSGVATNTWMAGANLNPSYSGTVKITVTAKDIYSNTSTVIEWFVVAYVNANVIANIISHDNKFGVVIPANTLTKNTIISLFKHPFDEYKNSITREINKSEMVASIKSSFYPHTLLVRKNIYDAMIKKPIRVSSKVLSKVETNLAYNLNQQAIELKPLSDIYEVSIPASRLKNNFIVYFNENVLKELNYNNCNIYTFNENFGWQILDKNSLSKISASVNSGGLFAIFSDTRAPQIKLETKVNINEPFTTEYPEFVVNIEEYGSGIDFERTKAVFNKALVQTIGYDHRGIHRIKPIQPLNHGVNTLEIEAFDRAGNKSTLGNIRFMVLVPLKVLDIAIYPNPAKNIAILQIVANRNDLTEEDIVTTIYDSSGNKIKNLIGLQKYTENFGGVTRYLYKLVWDLTNNHETKVGNGVYYAKVKVTDPTNGKKHSFTLKVVVLQ